MLNQLRVHSRLSAILLAALVAVLTIVVVSALRPKQAASAPVSKEQRAALLVTAPTVPVDPSLGYFSDPAAAKARAAQLAKDVPTPNDRGGIAAVRWERIDGGVSEGDIVFMVQFNAACDWLKQFTGGVHDEQTRYILEQIPSWPPFRGNLIGEKVGEFVRAAEAGDQTPLTGWIERNCQPRR